MSQPPRATISAYVIAYNEAEKIEAALQSLLWADEIIVADSHSTDGTAQIATGLGARVVQIDFHGFGDLRNRALAHCTGDWIFSLDADERCTAEARDEILRVISDPAAADVYHVPRRNYFMGRWIRFSGWYPNFRQPQLFRRGMMRYDQQPVHEGWIAAPGARLGRLKADIWQFPFRDLGQIQEKARRYSTLGMQKLQERGRRGRMGGAVVHGAYSFVKHYLFKLGFLDGWAGFVIAFGTLEGAFYKHAKLYERQRRWSVPPPVRLERPPA